MFREFNKELQKLILTIATKIWKKMILSNIEWPQLTSLSC